MWNARAAKSSRAFSQLYAAGFTLLEVMVALAIVAIALVPLLRLHLLSLDATMRAQGLTTATLLAQASKIQSWRDSTGTQWSQRTK
jgi:general secretion pathway protein I